MNDCVSVEKSNYRNDWILFPRTRDYVDVVQLNVELTLLHSV